MTILFDACRLAKPARRFGAGLLAFVPMTTVTHTAADESAYTAMLADEAADRAAAAREFDAAIEDRYVRFAELDRVSRGPIL